MPDRTQTLSVEPMTEREINRALRSMRTTHPAPEFAETEDVEAHETAKAKLEAALSQPEHQGDDTAQKVIVDFLADWRFCPVSTASNPSRSCLEDAAKQLLAALPAQPPAGEVERLRERLLSDDVGIAVYEALIVEFDGIGPMRSCHSLVITEVAMKAAADHLARSDSQGDQERPACAHCNDTRKLSLPSIGKPKFQVCPYCNPAPTRPKTLTDDPDRHRGEGHQVHRYVPATQALPAVVPSEPSEALKYAHAVERAAAEAVRADKAEAERDEQDRMRAMNWETLEHWKAKCVAYRAALEELAAEFELRAGEKGLLPEIQGTWAHAAVRAREKAAKLKDGER